MLCHFLFLEFWVFSHIFEEEPLSNENIDEEHLSSGIGDPIIIDSQGLTMMFVNFFLI